MQIQPQRIIMPTYAYKCPNGHNFSNQRGMNEPDQNTCPKCGTTSLRDFSIGRIKFKGDGFYSTDKAE
jgi:putative FmdB family regulatory protein